MSLQRSNSTTTARESPAAETEPTSETPTLAPVHVGEEVLKGLPLWQTYLLSELLIVPTDSSWRAIAVTDQGKFVTDAAMYVFIIIYIEKRYHNYRKTLS